MSQVIKFRVRRKDHGKVVGYEMLFPTETDNSEYEWAQSLNGTDWMSGTVYGKGYLREQFTGLSTNGQEIYDGDILECDSDWYQVAWDAHDARWEAIGIHDTGETLALSELPGQETWVQGNINQNSDIDS